MADVDEKDCQANAEQSIDENKEKKKHKKVRHHKKEEDGKEVKGRRKRKIKKTPSQAADCSPVPEPAPEQSNGGLSVEVAQLASGKKISHFQAMAMLRKALVASMMTAKPHGNVSREEEKTEENKAMKEETKAQKRMSVSAIDIDISTLPKVESEGDTSGDEDKAAKAVAKVITKPSKWKIVETEFLEGVEPSKSQWRALLMHDLFPRMEPTREELGEEADEESGEEIQEEDSDDSDVK